MKIEKLTLPADGLISETELIVSREFEVSDIVEFCKKTENEKGVLMVDFDNGKLGTLQFWLDRQLSDFEYEQECKKRTAAELVYGIAELLGVGID